MKREAAMIVVAFGFLILLGSILHGLKKPKTVTSAIRTVADLGKARSYVRASRGMFNL